MLEPKSTTWSSSWSGDFVDYVVSPNGTLYFYGRNSYYGSDRLYKAELVDDGAWGTYYEETELYAAATIHDEGFIYGYNKDLDVNFLMQSKDGFYASLDGYGTNDQENITYFPYSGGMIDTGIPDRYDPDEFFLFGDDTIVRLQGPWIHPSYAYTASNNSTWTSAEIFDPLGPHHDYDTFRVEMDSEIIYSAPLLNETTTPQELRSGYRLMSFTFANQSHWEITQVDAWLDTNGDGQSNQYRWGNIREHGSMGELFYLFGRVDNASNLHKYLTIYNTTSGEISLKSIDTFEHHSPLGFSVIDSPSGLAITAYISNTPEQFRQRELWIYSKENNSIWKFYDSTDLSLWNVPFELYDDDQSPINAVVASGYIFFVDFIFNLSSGEMLNDSSYASQTPFSNSQVSLSSGIGSDHWILLRQEKYLGNEYGDYYFFGTYEGDHRKYASAKSWNVNIHFISYAQSRFTTNSSFIFSWGQNTERTMNHIIFTPTPDRDGDEICDGLDNDIDGDGFTNQDDAFPFDIEENSDFDGDGLGDNSDTDDDNDGYSDDIDKFPFDNMEWSDNDNDGIGDNRDSDDDNDGILDFDDIWPFDPCVSNDTDNDGLADQSLNNCETQISIDDDDDGDGITDVNDFCSPGETNWTSGAAIGTDHDGDGCRDDGEDTDDDGDGVEDLDDNCPRGHTGWTSNPSNDIDGDGCHESEDYDRDGDNHNDTEDSFPEDPQEWLDSDGDGVGDNADAYPNESTRWEFDEDDGSTSVILLVTIFLLLIAAIVIILKRK